MANGNEDYSLCGCDDEHPDDEAREPQCPIILAVVIGAVIIIIMSAVVFLGAVICLGWFLFDQYRYLVCEVRKEVTKGRR